MILPESEPWALSITESVGRQETRCTGLWAQFLLFDQLQSGLEFSGSSSKPMPIKFTVVIQSTGVLMTIYSRRRRNKNLAGLAYYA